MNHTDAILFDLDGTIWDGSEGAPGALAFLQTVREAGLPHLFLSNNSWQTPDAVAARLRRLGVPAGAEDVLTAGAAAGPLIRAHMGAARLLVLGSPALTQMLASAGHTPLDPGAASSCDAVVVGLASWSYADLTAACQAVASGRPLIAVNLDRTMPGDGGALVPKPGTLVAAIRAAVPNAPDPLVVGKPAQPLFQHSLERLGLPPSRVTMVGDGLETDVAGGRAAGLRTVWLHRGRPARTGTADAVVRDLAEWLNQ